MDSGVAGGEGILGFDRLLHGAADGRRDLPVGVDRADHDDLAEPEPFAATPDEAPWLKRVGHMAEWASVPLIAVLLSAVPALDAQTRLMLGRYLEFWVTEKPRG